jgi:hypothetical protein
MPADCLYLMCWGRVLSMCGVWIELANWIMALDLSCNIFEVDNIIPNLVSV